MTRMPTGPQEPQRFAPRVGVQGLLRLEGDRDGWPKMPPPRGNALERASLPKMAGYDPMRPRLGVQGMAMRGHVEPAQQRQTGHPTGNVPALTTFPQGMALASPILEPLVEGSHEALQNRLTVYHAMGGVRGSHPDGDYVAPDGHRSRTLPEHLAWMKEHVQAAKFRDARSGATFTDARALHGHQVAYRMKSGVGTIGKAHSTK